MNGIRMNEWLRIGNEGGEGLSRNILLYIIELIGGVQQQ